MKFEKIMICSNLALEYFLCDLIVFFNQNTSVRFLLVNDTDDILNGKWFVRRVRDLQEAKKKQSTKKIVEEKILQNEFSFWNKSETILKNI